MGNSAVRKLFVCFLLFTGAIKVPAQAERETQDVAEKTSWALEALTFESTKPTFLWVGVKNRGEARLVCILYRGIGFTARDGTSKLQGSGGSPHACDAADQFQLVRAGETLFTRLTLPKGFAERVAGKIRVELSVVDRPVMGNTSRREPVGVTWEGTLQEAADLGRTLTTAAPKGK